MSRGDTVLFTISFAGGSSYAFQPLVNELEPFMEIHTLEYPGRGRKITSPCIKNAEELAEIVLKQLQAKLDQRPFAILGHSMGCLINYLIAHRLQQLQLPQPFVLFMSGMAGPSDPLKERGRHLLEGSDFWKIIGAMGGTPKEIVEDDSLRAFFEPILKCDFEALDTHQYEQRPALETPISVLLGEQDRISSESAKLWQQETSFPLRLQSFPGGHFFLFEHASETAKHIVKEIEHFKSKLTSPKPLQSSPS